MSQRSKVYGVLAVAVLCGAAAYVYKTKPAWFGKGPGSVAQAKSGDAARKDKDATPVELATAKRSPISSYLTATANLRALRDVAVSALVEGIVLKVIAEEGDFVKEGQTLCVFDDAQMQIRLKLAQEKLAQARLQMDKAKIRQEKAVAQIGHTRNELERYQKAQKEGLVSDKETATYQYKLEELIHDQRVAASETQELQHKVGELEAEIAQSKLDISRTQIRAPFDGYVTARTVNIGQRVRPMDPMFNVGSFSPLYADVHLSEKDTRNVRPSQPATVKLGSDESASLQGRVERISPVVDQSSGTVKVTVAINPQAGFRPGAFVRVDIKTDTRAEAILIPKRALIEEDGQNYVFIAANDLAKRTKVQLGYQSEGMVEIRDGVAAGQRIVVAGQGALKEGSKLRVLSTQSGLAGKPAA